MTMLPVPILFKPGFSDEDRFECIEVLAHEFVVDLKHSMHTILTEDVLGRLYSNLREKDDQVLWDATCEAMLNEKVYVMTLIVDENDSGLESLVCRIGSNVDPERCEESSLRRRFGGKKQQIPGTKLFMFDNKIHRPRTREEAIAHFKALFSR